MANEVGGNEPVMSVPETVRSGDAADIHATEYTILKELRELWRTLRNSAEHIAKVTISVLGKDLQILWQKPWGRGALSWSRS